MKRLHTKTYYEMIEEMPRPVIYCDKYAEFFNLTSSESDLEYQRSEDKRFVFSLDYIQRLPSLIIDGIKV